MFFIKEKSYNDIIEEIKSKLTEDKKENISYLKKQAKKYKNHKMNEAILKEIGKNNITDDITKQIKNVLQKEQRENVMADEILMPAWIRTFIKQMYEL